MYSISIIIPTICAENRSKSLIHAIDSALNQEKMFVEVIVVVNGGRYHPALFEQLKANPRITVLYTEEGNVSKARYLGVSSCKQECFAFLDDDDEFLPNSLITGLKMLAEDNDAGAVINNGYDHDGTDHIVVDEHLRMAIQKSFALSCLDYNYFAPCSTIYKKAKIDIEIFNLDHKYFELTYLFFKLIEKQYKLLYSHLPVYRYACQSPDKITRTEAYLLAAPQALAQIRKMNLPANIKIGLKRKYVVSLNCVSSYLLANGKYFKALYFHAKCLLNGGAEYIFYSRKFLFIK